MTTPNQQLIQPSTPKDQCDVITYQAFFDDAVAFIYDNPTVTTTPEPQWTSVDYQEVLEDMADFIYKQKEKQKVPGGISGTQSEPQSPNKVCISSPDVFLDD
jgi:hypothetical protein